MGSQSFQETLAASLNSMWIGAVQFIPKLIGALVIFIILYIIARTIRKVVSTALEKIGVNQLFDKIGLSQSLFSAGIKAQPSAIIAKILFYLIMLGALIICADVLQLDKVTAAITSFINYTPSILGAVFILFLAQMAGMFIRGTLATASENLNFDYGKVIGNAIYALIVIIGIVLAFGQLQIETELLSNVIQILLLAAGASIGISLGLGTKTISNKIISGVYVREDFKDGDTIRFKDIEGEVLSVGSITTKVKKENGEVVSIPNNLLLESVVVYKKS